MGDAKEWYQKSLECIYPILFLDAVHFKAKEDHRVVTKAAYVALGITTEGQKDVLGIWIGENEGAKFWLKVCNELKSRGVQEILIVCFLISYCPKALNPGGWGQVHQGLNKQHMLTLN